MNARHIPQATDRDDHELMRRLLEAASDGDDATLEGVDPARRNRLLDALESFGYLECRPGDPDRGENADDFFPCAITPLGRLKLLDLRRPMHDDT